MITAPLKAGRGGDCTKVCSVPRPKHEYGEGVITGGGMFTGSIEHGVLVF